MDIIENRIQDLLRKSWSAIIWEWVEFEIVQWNRWSCSENWGRKYSVMYNKDTVDNSSDLCIFSNIVNSICAVKYDSLRNNSIECVKYVKSPSDVYWLLLECFLMVFMQNHMKLDHPGTRVLFRYLFDFNDSQIAWDVESKAPKHIQYILWCEKVINNKEYSYLDHTVVEALDKTRRDIISISYQTEYIEMMRLVTEKLWGTYFSLYEEEKKESGGAWSNADPMTQELKDKSSKKNLKTQNPLEDIKNLMKGISTGINDTKKANFWKDIDEEYSAKEQESEPIGDELLEQASELDAMNIWQDKTPYPILYRDIYHLIYPMKKVLNSIMKDNTYNRFGGNYRSGKLSTKKLYRLETWSDKLFGRKIVRNHKDYKVSILVDNSGSMSGENVINATRGCVLLAEVLNSVGIDFEIMSFSDQPKVVKWFNNSLSSKERTAIEWMITSVWWGTRDARAVRLSHNNLMSKSTRESERIMFVLSDGDSGEWSQLQEEIEIAERDTYVFGIGIKTPSIANYYNNFSIVNDIDSLPVVMMEELRKMIKRW